MYTVVGLAVTWPMYLAAVDLMQFIKKFFKAQVNAVNT